MVNLKGKVLRCLKKHPAPLHIGTEPCEHVEGLALEMSGVGEVSPLSLIAKKAPQHAASQQRAHPSPFSGKCETVVPPHHRHPPHCSSSGVPVQSKARRLLLSR